MHDTHSLAVGVIPGPPGTGKTVTAACLLETLVLLRGRRRAGGAHGPRPSHTPGPADSRSLSQDHQRGPQPRPSDTPRPSDARQSARGHGLILGTAHSNAAADNLMSKLMAVNLSVL